LVEVVIREEQMIVWTYVIQVDAGAAPNFEAPATTLTVCKPQIRMRAGPGDLVLAFNGTKLNPDDPHSVCWAGVVGEVLGMGDYWKDERFQSKKPGRSLTPDNIYRPMRSGELRRVENSTHTPTDYQRDVGGINALIFESSWHFGPFGPQLPHRFGLRMLGGRRGHRRVEIDGPSWTQVKTWLDRQAASSALKKLTDRNDTTRGLSRRC
jgi:hypothetical protein